MIKRARLRFGGAADLTMLLSYTCHRARKSISLMGHDQLCDEPVEDWSYPLGFQIQGWCTRASLGAGAMNPLNVILQ